ncbi:MAG: PEP/pyruvate-binding domain-containing protein [Actinomycetota bacterium]
MLRERVALEGSHAEIPPVLALDDQRAWAPNLVGSKAANLARAAGLGMPVLPGFVLTTEACSAIMGAPGYSLGPDLETAVEAAWEGLSQDGRRPLVVRSSSSVEDTESSSMAGMFTSVLGVCDWRTFVDALKAVLASASRAGIEGAAPMAVLVQPQLEPSRGGVMFGLDPVSGRRDVVTVAAVLGGPDKLVSGTEEGTRYTLSKRGRVLGVEGAEPFVPLSARQRRALARLAHRASVAFGGPQDVEWAFDLKDRVWLFQARPITATGTAPAAHGPILGPGPVAETFPDPLSTLEAELWVDPMRTALREALTISGAAPFKKVMASDAVSIVGGRVAADLELLNALPKRASLIARLDPRPPTRRLLAAWRVGRLKVALPGIVSDVIERTDDELSSIVHPSTMSDGELLALLHGARAALLALHGHEMLAGMLMPQNATGAGGAASALKALAQGRAEGLSDDNIVTRFPVVLALVPPRIDGKTRLPDLPNSIPDLRDSEDPLGRARENLRLRARFVQELSARVASELGRRLTGSHVFRVPDHVRWVGLDELRDAIDGGGAPADIEARRSAPVAAPLPAAFRLTPDGDIVPVTTGSPTAGRGAGGGRGAGRVHGGEGHPQAGAVLVVRTLDPTLASLLPILGGLVAETGSPLSHLAILAREYGVPTVVGVTDALVRFQPGAEVVVDGTSGEVRLADEGASR